jgi:ubiquinone/menaquinone biosynthesis C-methylase UbiE
MSNDMGLVPSNGHRIQGRSSESFINARDVISRLKLRGDEVFMDAGCGDGHVAMIAQDLMSDDALIYALDIYQPSIEDLKETVQAQKITNLIPLQSDIAGDIALDDDTVDVCLMINVFHHFVAQDNIEEAILELKRILKPGGKVAVMDYKKMDTGYGPPLKFKVSPDEVEEMFTTHGFRMVQRDTEVGEDLKEGIKSHYLVVFQKK